MSFTVATFQAATLAALIGALSGITFARMSARPLTRAVVSGLLASLIVAVSGVVAFMIGAPNMSKDTAAGPATALLVEWGLSLLINVAPAILAATLGFGFAGRVTRLATGRTAESV